MTTQMNAGTSAGVVPEMKGRNLREEDNSEGSSEPSDVEESIRAPGSELIKQTTRRKLFPFLEGNDERHRLKNELARPIEISKKVEDGIPISIPPFGEIEISKSKFKKYSTGAWTARNIVTNTPIQRTKFHLPSFLMVIWGGALVYGGLFWLGFLVFSSDHEAPDYYWTGVTTIALVLSFVGFVVSVKEVSFWKSLLPGMVQMFTHFFSASVQVTIALGLPVLFLALTLVPFDLQTTKIDSWVNPHIAGINSELNWGETMDAWRDGFLALTSKELVARTLQIIFIGTVSMLPALLFYLFDRFRMSTLREEFFRSVVLILPTLRTTIGAKSVYGGRADEILGKIPEGSAASRLAPNNRAIIVVNTIIVTLGWTATLISDTSSQGGELVKYFVPADTPMTYAFLGAYAFGISLLFRRYTRSDLKPSAYASFTIRIITAVVITWAAEKLWIAGDFGGQEVLLVFAFVIGFFPDTGLTAITEFVRNREFIVSKIPSLEEKFPLEKLDGVNIYHRSRLIDEGVENMENLAHSDLVELMLHTRIPLPTLIDWIDQSVLMLHVLGRDKAEGDKDMQTLRSYGLRTATDVEQAFLRAKRQKNASQFLGLLGGKGDVQRLKVILDALSDDEWMPSIRVWRNPQRYRYDVLRECDLEDWDRTEFIGHNFSQVVSAKRRK